LLFFNDMVCLLGRVFHHLTRCVLKVVQWPLSDKSIETNKLIEFTYLSSLLTRGAKFASLDEGAVPASVQ
jgi:hypothetical protein